MPLELVQEFKPHGEVPERFTLHLTGTSRIRNGVPVEDADFEHGGLRFETGIMPACEGCEASVTLTILQDGVPLFGLRSMYSIEVQCESERRIVIVWVTAGSRMRGKSAITRGWVVEKNNGNGSVPRR